MPEGDTTVATRVNVGRLLLRAFELFQERIVASIEEAGFPDVRPPDTQVFRNLDPDGTRITALAERARVSKQAMSQLVQDLEARGYVARRPDPEDGRAKRVHLTEEGRAVILAARSGRREIFDAWSEDLGEDGLASLQGLLTRLLEAEEALPGFQDPLDWVEI